MMDVSKQSLMLTAGQKQALSKMVDFIRDDNAKVFILKGYAGTGKTTLMKEFIRVLKERNECYSLLASTGRAAKILHNATDEYTTTVHHEIYIYSDLNQDLEALATQAEKTGVDASGQLFLKFTLTGTSRTGDSNMYYIVDEASMISDVEDKSTTQAIFGSGCLLTDLLSFDKHGKYVFVGDNCQLPPVGQAYSPALSAEYFKQKFDITAYVVELKEIVRQDKGNDITKSSSRVRLLYENPQPWKWAKFPFYGYQHIHILRSESELLNAYIEKVKQTNFNEAILIAYSNRQCGQLTNILRPAFGIQSSTLSKGDLLLVTQNNAALMNGDLVIVENVRLQEKRAGLTFLRVSVRELVNNLNYSMLMIADILYSGRTNLTQSQQKDLFIDFYYRMKNIGIKQKSLEFKEKMLQDPYLNALRAIYGFALTCHKAQGGEWNSVYLDIARNVPCLAKPYVYQWIYTAMTRAKKDLYVVDDFWIM